MKHYVLVETNVTNPAWIADYLKAVTPMVEQHGGRYLTRTANISVVEGDDGAPQFALLAEFPSKAAFEEFYNSEEYQPYKQARQKGSTSKMLIVAAEGI